MAASFIGATVALQLRGGQGVTGTIAHVDAASGSLGINLQSGQHIIVPRHDIADLKILPAAPQPAQQHGGPSVAASTSASVTRHVQVASEPAPSNAPAQYSHILQRSSSRASPRPANGKAKQRTRTPEPLASKSELAPAKASKKSQKKKSARSAAGPLAADPADDDEESDLDQDFDFDKALKTFDKKKIWDEIKTSDNSDPSLLLVSHNRRTQDANGNFSEGRKAQEKLAWNEPVLSPSPPPSTEQAPVSIAKRTGPSHDADRGSTSNSRGNGSLSMHDVSGELDSIRTDSLQRDVELVQLREQLQQLQMKTAVLEALAGIDLEETSAQESSKEQRWRVRVYESVAAHAEARRHRSQSSVGAAEPSKGALTFALSTEAALTKGTDARATRSVAKLRYLGAEAAQTDPIILARLPAQYKNQMGLKPESASVFLRRVKDAVQGASATP